MKLAFAGKGGVGKTTLAALTADYLARQGHDVWMVDADTALSLGQASGLSKADLPLPLVLREDLIRERIGTGLLDLNPEVGDLPSSLAVEVPLGGPAASGRKGGTKRLLVMGSVTAAGGGCACEANALLKAVLAHLVLEQGSHLVVDLEAGVEHLGRGTASHVNGLVVVSEPSRRSLDTAAEISRLARDLGIPRQILALNRSPGQVPLPELAGLPADVVRIPILAGLLDRQLTDASVLALPESRAMDDLIRAMLKPLHVE
jgi:CO dehydrogenase maturation factor